MRYDQHFAALGKIPGLGPPAPVTAWLRLGKEDAVAFVTEFSKTAGRGRQRRRDKVIIADGRRPRHLGVVADELTGEAPIDGIGVLELDPLFYPTPDHLEGYRAWRRRRPAA
jgi:hypothetical protein